MRGAASVDDAEQWIIWK